MNISSNERVTDSLTFGSCTMTTTKSVLVEFGGGLELLFSNQKTHKIGIPTMTPDDKPTNMNYLILWLKDNLLKDRQELFLDHDEVWVLDNFYEFHGLSSDASMTCAPGGRAFSS